MSSSGSGTVINYGSGSGTVINYGSGSDFLTSYGSGYGSGSTSQKVTVPPVPVPQHWLMVCMSCPHVSIPHPLPVPRPKRVGIQIPPASYSPAPPSLLPTLLTNPLHLIPSVTWLGHLDGPVLWLAIYLLLILSCLALSLSCQNKKDNLLLFLYVWPS